MVVDIETDTRRLFRYLIQDMGMEVIECRNGAEALQVLERGGNVLPDLILLELIFQDKSNWDGVTKILADPRWRHVPIIVTTTTPRDKIENQAREMGAVGILPKPFAILTFQQAVTLVLGVSL